MSLPPADELKRMFYPIPGNLEANLEQGMVGIKTVAGGSEIWYRPIADGATPIPDPIRIAVFGQDAEFKGLSTAPVLASGDTLVLLDSTLAFGMSLADIAGDAQLLFTADIMGFQDANLAAPMQLAAPGTTALDTTAQELVDSINEVLLGSTDAETLQDIDVEDRPLDLKALGPQLVVGSDCSDFNDFTAINSATLSNTVAGTTRATYNGVANFGFSQDVYAIGDNYLALCKVRCDATRDIRFSIGSTAVSDDKSVGTSWVYFLIQGTTAQVPIRIQLLTDAAGYVEVDYMRSFQIRDVKANYKTPDMQRLENLFTYSEDFTNDWAASRIDIDTNAGQLSPIVDRATGLQVEYQGLIAASTGGDQSHNTSQVVTVVADGKLVVYFAVKAGGRDWVRVRNGTTADNAYYDETNNAFGTISAGVSGSAIVTPYGTILKVQFPVSSGANIIQIYTAEADNDPVYTGDDVTIETFITGIQSYEGTLADNFPYVKTTTVAQTGKHEYRHETESIDEYRERLGLKELLDSQGFTTNYFETPVVGSEYLDGTWKGHQVYGQAFRLDPVTGTGTLAAITNASVVASIETIGTIENATGQYSVIFGSSTQQIQFYGETTNLKYFASVDIAGIDIWQRYIKDFVAVP